MKQELNVEITSDLLPHQINTKFQFEGGKKDWEEIGSWANKGRNNKHKTRIYSVGLQTINEYILCKWTCKWSKFPCEEETQKGQFFEDQKWQKLRIEKKDCTAIVQKLTSTTERASELSTLQVNSKVDLKLYTFDSTLCALSNMNKFCYRQQR